MAKGVVAGPMIFGTGHGVRELCISTIIDIVFLNIALGNP